MTWYGVRFEPATRDVRRCDEWYARDEGSSKVKKLLPSTVYKLPSTGYRLHIEFGYLHLAISPLR